MIQIRLLSVLALVALAAACGGGGGGGGTSTLPTGGGAANPTSTPTSAAIPAGQAAVRFAITVPKSGTSSTNRRGAQFVDPNTQSLTLTLIQANGQTVSGGAVQGPFNLVSGATGCTSTGTLTCTFSINAPITNPGQTDVFVANTFASPNAVGPLGSGAVSLAVVQNATNTANLILSGPVASVVVVSNNSANEDTLWDGLANGEFIPITAAQASSNNSDSKMVRKAPQTIATAQPIPIPSERLFVIAQDSQGNVILNPTTYNQAVQLTLHTNGGTPNATLADVPPAGLTCPGSGTSTSTDGGSILVCSPSDVVTLTIASGIPSAQVNIDLCCGTFLINFPFLTVALPSAPTTVLTTFPFTVEAAGGASLPIVAQ